MDINIKKYVGRFKKEGDSEGGREREREREREKEFWTKAHSPFLSR